MSGWPPVDAGRTTLLSLPPCQTISPCRLTVEPFSVTCVEQLRTGAAASALVFVFGVGLRHGCDADHLAALADIAGLRLPLGRSMLLSFAYVVGHAAVVFALGFAGIALGLSLPPWLDTVMEKMVGVTLLCLSGWVVIRLLTGKQATS